MNRKVVLTSNSDCVHFELDSSYLGMFVFKKGELSDFRAIIRKNKQRIDSINCRKVLETSLYELLIHFLSEREHVSVEKLQAVKEEIVRASAGVLDKEAKNIEKYLVNC